MKLTNQIDFNRFALVEGAQPGNRQKNYHLRQFQHSSTPRFAATTSDHFILQYHFPNLESISLLYQFNLKPYLIMPFTDDATLAYLCNIPFPSTVEASQDTITITISRLTSAKQSQGTELEQLKIQNEHLKSQTEGIIKERDLYEKKLQALSLIMAESYRESAHFGKEITLPLGDPEMFLVHPARVYSCWWNHY